MSKQDQTYSLTDKKVWVAGHRGMVGSAIVRRLESESPAKILTTTRQELDLLDQGAVNSWIASERPDAIFLAAAKVGGILANDTYPADFLYENMVIASNIIHAAHIHNVEKLLFLGSSCIYPKLAPQPIEEGSLLTGPLEPTNEWYAVAKIAGIKLCQAYRKQYGRDFISAMPTNLYGMGDNFHMQNSHVVPALISKAHSAKVNGAPSMEIWGTGTPRREFMHADDCADAIIYIMKNYSDHEHINVGYGSDVTIEELAHLTMKVVGFTGKLTKNTTKPDGSPQKLMCNKRLLALGWEPRIDLEAGLSLAYEWYAANIDDLRKV